MGIVQKQALSNTIISYAGVALGYINLVLLFPKYFTTEQFGLIQTIITVSILYAQLSSFGLVNIVHKFFPFYQTEDKKHKDFLNWVFIIAISGFIITSVIYLISRPLVIQAFIEKSSLFLDYFFTSMLLAFITLFFNIFEVLARMIFKTIFATLTREVILRALTSLGIGFYAGEIITFEKFVDYYILINILCVLLLLGEILKSREFQINFNLKATLFGLKNNSKNFFEIIKYGGYTLLSSSAMLIGQRVDALIIGSFIGLSIVGVYTTFFYIATVIYIPVRVLSKVAVPIIANSWKKNDLQQILDIYNRTSLIQLILGFLLYIGIIINKENLLFFLSKPEFRENFNIFYFVGIAFLCDMAVGLNSEIISTSHKFRFDTWFNIILLAVSIITNLIFIPLYGGLGAAFATMISFIVFNFIKWRFVKNEFNMQPWKLKRLFVIIIIAAISFLIGNNIPKIPIIYLDILVRSSITTLVYFSLIILFKVSEDINIKYLKYLNKLKLILGK